MVLFWGVIMLKVLGRRHPQRAHVVNASGHTSSTSLDPVVARVGVLCARCVRVVCALYAGCTRVVRAYICGDMRLRQAIEGIYSKRTHFIRVGTR